MGGMNHQPCKQFLAISTYALIAALVFGCGVSSQPPERAAGTEFVLENKFDFMSKSRLTSFKKINGQSSEVFGVKYYEIDYEAEVVFTQDIPRRIGCAEFIEGDCGGHRSGEKKIVKGKIAFEQTENGWKGRSGNVY